MVFMVFSCLDDHGPLKVALPFMSFLYVFKHEHVSAHSVSSSLLLLKSAIFLLPACVYSSVSPASRLAVLRSALQWSRRKAGWGISAPARLGLLVHSLWVCPKGGWSWPGEQQNISSSKVFVSTAGIPVLSFPIFFGLNLQSVSFQACIFTFHSFSLLLPILCLTCSFLQVKWPRLRSSQCWAPWKDGVVSCSLYLCLFIQVYFFSDLGGYFPLVIS